jgi:hypothetical protein
MGDRASTTERRGVERDRDGRCCADTGAVEVTAKAVRWISHTSAQTMGIVETQAEAVSVCLSERELAEAVVVACTAVNGANVEPPSVSGVVGKMLPNDCVSTAENRSRSVAVCAPGCSNGGHENVVDVP